MRSCSVHEHYHSCQYPGFHVCRRVNRLLKIQRELAAPHVNGCIGCCVGWATRQRWRDAPFILERHCHTGEYLRHIAPAALLSKTESHLPPPYPALRGFASSLPCSICLPSAAPSKAVTVSICPAIFASVSSMASSRVSTPAGHRQTPPGASDSGAEMAAGLRVSRVRFVAAAGGGVSSRPKSHSTDTSHKRAISESISDRGILPFS